MKSRKPMGVARPGVKPSFLTRFGLNTKAYGPWRSYGPSVFAISGIFGGMCFLLGGSMNTMPDAAVTAASLNVAGDGLILTSVSLLTLLVVPPITTRLAAKKGNAILLPDAQYKARTLAEKHPDLPVEPFEMLTDTLLRTRELHTDNARIMTTNPNPKEKEPATMTTQTPSTKSRDIPEEEIQALLDKDLGPEAARINELIQEFVSKFKAAFIAALVAVLATIGLLITAIVMGVSHGFAAAVPFLFFSVAAVAVVVAMVKVIRLKGAQIVYLYESLEAINAKLSDHIKAQQENIEAQQENIKMVQRDIEAIRAGQDPTS